MNYEKLVKLSGVKSEDFYKLGLLRCHIARSEKKPLAYNLKAVSAFSSAIALDKNNGKAYFFRGTKLFELESYVKAEQSLEQAVRLLPTDLESKLRLAITDIYLYKYGRAETLLEQVLAREAANADAAANLAFISAERRRNLPRAKQLITLALRKKRTNPFYLDVAGWVECRSQNPVKGLSYLKTIKARDFLASYHMAECYLALKKADLVKARGALRAAENKLRPVKDRSPLEKNVAAAIKICYKKIASIGEQRQKDAAAAEKRRQEEARRRREEEKRRAEEKKRGVPAAAKKLPEIKSDTTINRTEVRSDEKEKKRREESERHRRVMEKILEGK